MVDFPSAYGIITIGDYAFYNCGFTSVYLNNNVTSIGDSAFKNCSALSQIYIANPEVAVAKDTFSNCSESLSISAPMESTVKDYCEQNGIGFNPIGLYGDINNDGKVNVKDVTYLQKHLAGFEDFKIVDGSRAFYAADVNGNGDLEITDCTTIMKYAVRAIDKFPVEQ